MRCDEFQRRLSDLLDQRQLPENDAPLLSHADRCPACRRQLAAWEAVETGLHAEQRPQPPADLVRHVLAELSPAPSASPPATRQYRAWATAALTVAALLLISLSFIFRTDSVSTARPDEGGTNATQDSVSNVGPELAPNHPLVAVEPVPADRSPEATADVNLPSEVGEGTDPYDYWYDRLSVESAESPYLHQSTWVEPVTATMRPLASTLTTAFNAVRSTLPRSKPPAGEPPQARLLDAPIFSRLG